MASISVRHLFSRVASSSRIAGCGEKTDSRKAIRKNASDWTAHTLSGYTSAAFSRDARNTKPPAATDSNGPRTSLGLLPELQPMKLKSALQIGIVCADRLRIPCGDLEGLKIEPSFRRRVRISNGNKFPLIPLRTPRATPTALNLAEQSFAKQMRPNLRCQI